MTRHPVELYAALILLVGAASIAIWRMRGRPAPGIPAGLALALAGFARIVTEPMRPTLGGGPTLWYWGGLILGIALVAWSWIRRDNAAIAQSAAKASESFESN